jgi:hypothetical protein
MLANHERELAAAKVRGQPLDQIAARELEVSRSGGALQRAEELTGDVAAGSEAAQESNASGAVIEQKSHRIARLKCGRVRALMRSKPGHFCHTGGDTSRPEGDAG